MTGERMHGGWVLVRTRVDDRGRAQWLLITHRDEFAREKPDVVATEMTSVVTGRTMDEISAAKPPRKKRAGTKRTATKARAGAKRITGKKPRKAAAKTRTSRAKRRTR
jgi:bifunctional non-homologous end joining protein LigD